MGGGGHLGLKGVSGADLCSNTGSIDWVNSEETARSVSF